jgi:hypothetical protein
MNTSSAIADPLRSRVKRERGCTSLPAFPATQNPELKTQNFESRLSRYALPE